MPTIEELHGAVVGAPDDEDARLAFADAIAARDPARAELIKVQIVLARWRRANESPEDRPAATAREAALLTEHGARWAEDVRPLVDKWQFLRGFVEVVWLDARVFLANALELYRRTPVLHLNLTGVKPVAAELFASPYLAGIHSLVLARNQLGDAEVLLFANSPHLADLRWVDLADNEIGAAGVETLAASDRFPRLGYVRLAWNKVDDPTPQHADAYDADSAVATALQAKYGHRPWLDASPRPQWPPARDAI